METISIEITSRYNLIFTLKVENNVVKLFEGSKLLSTVTIPDNHCGCGLGNCSHKNYPNNIKAFNFGKVISAVDFIRWNMWGKTKQANKKFNSYELKHVVEKSKEYQNSCRSNGVENFNHLANGELILAMQLVGFKIYTIPNGNSISHNVFFNIETNPYMGPNA